MTTTDSSAERPRRASPTPSELDTATSMAQVEAAVRLRGPAAVEGAPQRYVGLVTRLLGFVVDALIINLVAAFSWAVVALTMSALSVPDSVNAAIVGIMGIIYLVCAGGYFVAFWSGTGQTPGARALEFRVVDAQDGKPIKLGRAVARLAGMVLGAIPFFAGFILGLFNARCRCLLDLFGDTVVIDAPVYTVADRRRMAREAATSKYNPRHSAAEQRIELDGSDAL
ncbi:MAG: RDD family protein [Solirubrobacteraceae bacterium]|nr:RDD family protein [Solirubrobacteraceae bacterium]MDP4673375.1 RDD family protein [Solirubrobacteraceae bacterium]MDP4921715.1 RDD family protein [Solirubrobacteraceae bacterium]